MVKQHRIDWDSTAPVALRVHWAFIDGCHRESIDRGAEADRIQVVLRHDLRCARLTLPTIG